MTLDYISGFFDADGSITMSKNSKNDKYRTIKIDFTNTKLNILLDIQKYLLDNHNLKLSISTKQSKQLNHSIGYSLSLNSNLKCLQLCKLLKSIHPMKLHRINTILKYHKIVTSKNGKYSLSEINRKLAYERLFFCSIFQ